MSVVMRQGGLPPPASLDRPARARRALQILASEPPPTKVAQQIAPRSVRLSLTDRCDFACTYCRPSRSEPYAEARLLPSEWVGVIDGLIAAGVKRFRLTGGEPLLVPHVVEVVAAIKARGAEDVALTTNASRLARLAKPLKDAGLDRINVSIDSLHEDRFDAITRGGRLADVLEGIDAALAAGLTPLKLNAVILRGVNDDELHDLTRFAWERRMVPRFLEVMPIAEGAKLVGEHLVSVVEMQRTLADLVEPGPSALEPDRGPAKYLRARHEPSLRVGFISGTTDTYCASCDRLRVSSTGVLRPCLATDVGVDARAEAARGDTSAFAERLEEAWSQKPDGQTFHGCTEESAAGVSMRAIGG